LSKNKNHWWIEKAN
jgi:hypothetical protein